MENSPSTLHALEIAVVEMSGEARILDTDLGVRLGFERPRKIRELIERHASELATLGQVVSRGALLSRPQGGVVEVQECYLNEEQALLICMASETEVARQIRAMLIKVFVAYRRGQLKQEMAKLAPKILSTAHGKRKEKIYDIIRYHGPIAAYEVLSQYRDAVKGNARQNAFAVAGKILEEMIETGAIKVVEKTRLSTILQIA